MIAVAPALLLVAQPLAALAEFAAEQPYEEVLDPPTPVRGHAVVGALALESNQDAGWKSNPQSKTLWVRAGEPGPNHRIRVDMSSANGRLRGEGTWRFEPREKQLWYALAVPPKDGRPAKADQLAVAVRPAGDESGGKPVYYLAALAPDKPLPASKLTVRLYVNSRRAEVAVYTSDGRATPCNAVEQTQVVRFDKTCDLIGLPIGDTPNAVDLTIVRRDGHQTARQQISLRW